MTILAIDSSGLVASVAIISDDILVAEYTINYKKTHSITLLPMLDEIITMTETDINNIDAISVSGGPGSFTGLRIGSSTAKGLGLVMNKPLINIPTLEGLAYNLYNTDKLICPILDARRNQVYTGLYEIINNELSIISEPKAVLIDDIIKEINQINREVIFLGDGISVYQDNIKSLINVPYTYAPPHLNRQKAGSIGALGMIYYKKGITQSAKEYAPKYLRQSQAERELQEKGIPINDNN